MSPTWLLLVPAAMLAWTHLVAVVGFAVQAADRNVPIGLTPVVLARVSREAGARMVLGLLGWFAWGAPTPKSGPAPSDSASSHKGLPVVLVPGMTFNRASLWPLALYLRKRGVAWVYPIDRLDRAGTLASEAEALATEIGRMRAASGAARVDVVAFSTGGLVVAWYLRHHGPHAVRRLVTIATPWRGTRLAVFGRGRAVEEIRYGSHVLDDLWPPPVPCTCVYSTDDPVVVPSDSAVPAHAADAVRVDEAGHMELLLSARVYRSVLAAIEQPTMVEPDAEPAA
ncbi:MAG: alpha/beta fold hydrolase [Myxococcota bacterium]